MPKVLLTAGLVRDATIPNPGRSKLDLFDTRCKGLLLEIRASGGKTWYLRYTDARGKQRQLRIADARDLPLERARKRADELRGRIALGQDPAKERAVLRAVPTFATFVAERYLPYVKGYKRSWSVDAAMLRNHLLPHFGNKRLDEISNQDVVDVHLASRAAGAVPATCNRRLVLLHYILNLALRWKVPGITTNPAHGVRLFNENGKRERYLTKEEIQRLDAALLESGNAQLRYIVLMLILTGARKREVLDASWEDFDIPRRSWRIPMTKSGKHRHVPISEVLAQLLGSIPRFEGCPFVVPNPKTLKPYHCVYYCWNIARRKAGLADVRVHDLRHSYASFLVNAGRSLYEVQKNLGHARISTTERYAHLAPDTLLAAANTAAEAAGICLVPSSIPESPGVAIGESP